MSITSSATPPPYRLWKSRIATRSEEFLANRQANLALLETLNGHLAKAAFQGAEKHLARARSLGKYTARERIEKLLDPGSPFLELLPLAGLGGDGFGPGGTSVGGIGLVSGRLFMIIANVGTRKGGAIDYATLQKALRLNEISIENRLPVISLVESSGANLPEQARIFNYGGATFRDITRRSKLGLANIAVVFGNSTAGGAYVPGMSDYSVFVQGGAKVFLAGPPLVKMATGEDVDDESLGGAAMHSRVSGVSDYLAADEDDALRIAREIAAGIPMPQTAWRAAAAEPAYDQEELLGILPPDLRKPFDMREVIARIVDGSRFAEFKAEYGPTLITGFAELHGFPVGILANNGVLFSEAANKGAHFIQLCNQRQHPILFFQNITGFMVGKDYEEGGIIKHGAKLINAVSNSQVPAITVMMGASYGAGNYAMAGRAYQPRFLFSYPHSRVAVMGPEQLSGVMQSIQREAALKAGIPYDEAQGAQMREYMMKEVEKKSDAWYSTGQLWDDGIMDPRNTRATLGFCLEVIGQYPTESNRQYGVFRM
jgi:acetyl-CoA carboxylase carboxyltransferase component